MTLFWLTSQPIKLTKEVLGPQLLEKKVNMYAHMEDAWLHAIIHCLLLQGLTLGDRQQK